MSRIGRIRALEILDSRGNPTLSVTVVLENGVRGQAHVPSGASTGRHEAWELRDGDRARYGGKGAHQAARNVEQEIAPALAGMNPEEQAAIDRRMIELDGTPNKSRLGANAILGVSCAAARAAAAARGVPLWRSLPAQTKPSLPVPMVNIISGGLHAGGRIEIQDFLVIPHGFPSTRERIEAVVRIHGATRALLEAQGYVLTGVADEGGWGPALSSNELALEILTRAIEQAGYAPGDQAAIAIDCASTHFFENGSYHLHSEGRRLTREQMIDTLERWTARFPVRSIEDGLEEDDWEGWSELTTRLGSRIQLIGDDFFTTNPVRLRKGVQLRAANAVLVKMNQIGTLSETFEVLHIAREAGYSAVVSARSGETEDSFLADLAVASGAGQIKVGSITRSERLAKYNRLLEIEAEEFTSAG